LLIAHEPEMVGVPEPEGIMTITDRGTLLRKRFVTI
jgi:hypothetical protein